MAYMPTMGLTRTVADPGFLEWGVAFCRRPQEEWGGKAVVPLWVGSNFEN